MTIMSIILFFMCLFFWFFWGFGIRSAYVDDHNHGDSFYVISIYELITLHYIKLHFMPLYTAVHAYIHSCTCLHGISQCSHLVALNPYCHCTTMPMST